MEIKLNSNEKTIQLKTNKTSEELETFLKDHFSEKVLKTYTLKIAPKNKTYKNFIGL